jgi:hypothetical protein
MLVQYPGPDGAVRIPDAIDGRPVTEIHPGAFRFRRNLTSLHIPASVKFIGEFAFQLCKGPTSPPGGLMNRKFTLDLVTKEYQPYAALADSPP